MHSNRSQQLPGMPSPGEMIRGTIPTSHFGTRQIPSKHSHLEHKSDTIIERQECTRTCSCLAGNPGSRKMCSRQHSLPPGLSSLSLLYKPKLLVFLCLGLSTKSSRDGLCFQTCLKMLTWYPPLQCFHLTKCLGKAPGIHILKQASGTSLGPACQSSIHWLCCGWLVQHYCPSSLFLD